MRMKGRINDPSKVHVFALSGDQLQNRGFTHSRLATMQTSPGIDEVTTTIDPANRLQSHTVCHLATMCDYT
jgi:hypothetical protein